jgi:hypothetical protein
VLLSSFLLLHDCWSASLSAVTRFVDPANPTEEELRRWALSGDLEPMQDWDVMLADEANGDVLIDLIEEAMRPATFLRSLYVLAGDGVRTAFHSCSRQSLERLVERASGSEHPWVRTWGPRTEALIAHPETFNYSDWCDGGLAANPTAP